MLKIELNDYGIEDTLKEISIDLESAIESRSKKQKNEIMNRVLGAIETLCYIMNITEVDVDIENKGESK